MKATVVMLLMLPLCVSAQVHYTDIVPDTLIADDMNAPGEYYLDLDGNGQEDFFFMHFYYPVPVYLPSVYTSFGEKGEILVTQENTPVPLSADTEIGPSSENWLCTAEGSGSTGLDLKPWRGAGDRYLGLRFRRGTAWQYAWVRLSVKEDLTGFHIRDYAWQGEADTPIRAGEGGVTAVHPPRELTTIDVRITGRTVTIETRQPGGMDLVVCDFCGRKLLERATSGDRLTCDLHALASGMYLLRVTAGGEMQVRRVVLFRSSAAAAGIIH